MFSVTLWLLTFLISEVCSLSCLITFASHTGCVRTPAVCEWGSVCSLTCFVTWSWPEILNGKTNCCLILVVDVRLSVKLCSYGRESFSKMVKLDQTCLVQKQLMLILSLNSHWDTFYYVYLAYIRSMEIACLCFLLCFDVSKDSSQIISCSFHFLIIFFIFVCHLHLVVFLPTSPCSLFLCFFYLIISLPYLHPRWLYGVRVCVWVHVQLPPVYHQQ